ncbi:MAG: ABC transporter ATP-binding protein [Chthoniobacterales bacterium]
MSESNPQNILEVSDLRKNFGEYEVLKGLSLNVPRGGILSVLGPSGAGKSVFLKCLAHIVQPDSGKIYFDNRLLNFEKAAIRNDFRKRCSFLFQSNALFDSLTALENVALPLEQTSDFSDAEIRTKSLQALDQLEIKDSAHHYPSQLSGGMQKRVALARAIVTQPELVFFDEPTAGLDPLRCNAVFTMIAQYQRQFNFTALIVTHDVLEATIASDRVALLEKGEICFEGTPDEFSSSPHPIVGSFRDNAQALREAISSIRQSPKNLNQT